MPRINGDQTSAGSIQVGLNPKDRTVIADELILRVVVVEKFDNLGIGLCQVLVIQTIFGRRALPYHNYEIVAVIGDTASKP